MKKILFVLLALFVLTFPFFCIAEGMEPNIIDSGEAIVPQPQEQLPYTWEYLATLAGATAATLLIVQFSKAPLDKVWKIPTRLFVYVIALAVLLIANAFTAGITVDNALLSAVNAFLVSLTAYGSYEVTFAKIGK